MPCKKRNKKYDRCVCHGSTNIPFSDFFENDMETYKNCFTQEKLFEELSTDEHGKVPFLTVFPLNSKDWEKHRKIYTATGY